MQNIQSRLLSRTICFLFLSGLFIFKNVSADVNTKNIEQLNVISTVKTAKRYIEKYGIKKAIVKFRNDSLDIFITDYDGMFYVSPLHPELIGKNQFNYTDFTGALVVQEEINKAKMGGGWLKGRWRKNPQTGKYQCRKIFILPISGYYVIGSWYHYNSNKHGVCPI